VGRGYVGFILEKTPEKARGRNCLGRDKGAMAGEKGGVRSISTPCSTGRKKKRDMKEL